MSMRTKLEIRGTTVDAARRFAERWRERQGYRAYLESLTDGERALMTGVVDRSGWYDVAAYASMLDKAARQLSPDDPEGFLSEGGRFVVDDGVNTLYRAFFAIASPRMVLRGSALMWRLFFRGSRLVIDRSGRGFVRAHVEGGDYCSRSLCVSIRGGMVCSLEHGGARSLAVDEHRCRSEGGDRCVFAFSWR
jgi:hypothetical protein